MAENVDYIDRKSIISEMLRTRQELIEFKASEEAILWWSMAMRFVKCFSAADVPEAGTAAVPKWTPALPESMPPENEDGLSDNLILRTVTNSGTLIFAGFTQCGKWHSAMAGKSDVLGEEFQVTHWMYMTDLAEVV